MEILNQKVEKALSRTSIPIGNYVLNPFRGCLIGCKYCYVQCNKVIKKIDKEWGEYLFIKENLIERLEEELNYLKDVKRILIGSTTEPFQLTEKYTITIEIINLLKQKNIPFVILTKQPHIAQYVEEISYSKENIVYLTLNSEIIREIFEKRSKSMEDRISAIEKIYKCKIKVIAYIGPFFPFLTDVDHLFKKLHKKIESIYIEAYHPGMGNFEEIKKILKEKEDTLEVLNNSKRYYEYWDKTKSHIEKLNTIYGYKVEFFIPDYNGFY